MIVITIVVCYTAYCIFERYCEHKEFTFKNKEDK